MGSWSTINANCNTKLTIDTQICQSGHKKANQDTKMLIMTLGSVIISIYGQMLPLVILALW